MITPGLWKQCAARLRCNHIPGQQSHQGNTICWIWSDSIYCTSICHGCFCHFHTRAGVPSWSWHLHWRMYIVWSLVDFAPLGFDVRIQPSCVFCPFVSSMWRNNVCCLSHCRVCASCLALRCHLHCDALQLVTLPKKRARERQTEQQCVLLVSYACCECFHSKVLSHVPTYSTNPNLMHASSTQNIGVTLHFDMTTAHIPWRCQRDPWRPSAAGMLPVLHHKPHSSPTQQPLCRCQWTWLQRQTGRLVCQASDDLGPISLATCVLSKDAISRRR